MSTQKKHQKTSIFITDFVVGGFSAAVCKTLTAPIERVKLLLQTQDVNKKVLSGTSKKYTGIINCFARVTTEEGFNSLWRGNLANILRYFPTQALNFAFKDFFRITFCPYDPKKEKWKYFFGSIVSGGMAGATSQVFVYPLDFGRTRLAADIGKGQQREFSGLYQCYQKIYRSDGMIGLYRGFSLSIFTIFIYRGLYFGIYDTGVGMGISKYGTIMKLFLAQFATNTAGMFAYPLDTIRRRLMMQSGRGELLYLNSFDCAKKIYFLEGGIKPFYKGGLSNILRGVGGSLVLVLYDEIQLLLLKQQFL